MGKSLSQLEAARLISQARLDAEKAPAQRNKLGQFASPPTLAEDILRFATGLLSKRKTIRFLDPAIGTGAFYSALRRTSAEKPSIEARGFEIDPSYFAVAKELWSSTGLQLTLGDFTVQKAEPKYNLLICNPPYVRHHHLANSEKERLHFETSKASGMKLAGLSGLYCYFMGLCHAWMADEGIAGWLVPSEFMDVNYGREVKRYLLEEVTLLHVHRFDPSDVQFADALVSSAIVWFKKAKPKKDHEVIFTFGGSLAKPKVIRRVTRQALAQEKKWTRFPVAAVRNLSTEPTIADFFRIKRGLATGDNSYFIMSHDDIVSRQLPREAFRPILPSPRYLDEDVVTSEINGDPKLEKKLFLLDPRRSENEIRRSWPTLWAYLEEGRARGLHERYLCKHRAVWYGQENRPPPPLVCTYLGRGDSKSGRPFRFILNQSQATVANVYLAMYPTPIVAQRMADDPEFMRRAWEILNAITPESLLGEGRVYGGGLHKLEPKELANVPVPALAKLLGVKPGYGGQTELTLDAAE